MKTRILVAIACFVLATILFTIGTYKAVQITEEIDRFGENTQSGSSGGGYPSYDETYVFLESGIASVVVGILVMIWRKRK